MLIDGWINRFKRLWDLSGFTQLFSGLDSWDWKTHDPSDAGEEINRTEPNSKPQVKPTKVMGRVAKGILPALKSSFKNKNKTIDPSLSSSKPPEATIEHCISLWLSSTFHYHHIHDHESIIKERDSNPTGTSRWIGIGGGGFPSITLVSILILVYDL